MRYFSRLMFGEHPSEAEISRFEEQWKCKLPEQFRDFILKYGCWGGDFGRYGGYYLCKSEYWFDGFAFDHPDDDDPDSRPLPRNWLTKPCPLTPDLKILNFDSDLYFHIDLTPRAGESDYDRDRRIHGERYEVFKDWKNHIPPYDIDPFQGCITIMDGGCSYCASLVVTGPARGRVIDMEYGGNSLPFFSDAKDFSEYVEHYERKS